MLYVPRSRPAPRSKPDYPGQRHPPRKRRANASRLEWTVQLKTRIPIWNVGRNISSFNFSFQTQPKPQNQNCGLTQMNTDCLSPFDLSPVKGSYILWSAS